jgi:magnesium-transporting ATPase (P-type)
MFKSIRKFLIFQLTVNIAAVLICFIGPLLGVNIVLTVTQLLMVNIVMDTLAAIAFGTEPALRQYMREKPISRTANIVTGPMFAQTIYGGLYLTVICLAILFVDSISNFVIGAKEFIGENAEATRIEYLRTCVFAVFMMIITFNGFNVRTNSLNLFTGITRNKNFLIIMGLIFVLQFVFITFGGKLFNVVPLSIESWISCILISLSIIPFDYVRRIVTYVKERGTFR